MVAIKAGGRVPSSLIGDALRLYSSRWLDRCEVDSMSKNRLILESVVSLLPSENGAVSCSFLLKLLKASNILKASSSSKAELATRVALQLEEATVSDLLIPCSSSSSTYDVDAFMAILEQFLQMGQSPPTSPPRNRACLDRRRSRSADLEFQESRRSSSSSHTSKLKVAKLVDGYLQEIANDKNLPLSKFIALAESIPNFARVDHDHLYKAIDIYLKGHPWLNKSERKELCRVLDCKKLSVEACMHAAQNEMLPLRVVVQVLFFEQARASMAGGHVAQLPSNIKALLAAHKAPSMATEDQWSVSGLKSTKSGVSTLKMKLAEKDELDDNFTSRIDKSTKLKSTNMIPSRSRSIFSKLFSRSVSEKN